MIHCDPWAQSILLEHAQVADAFGVDAGGRADYDDSKGVVWDACFC